MTRTKHTGKTRRQQDLTTGILTPGLEDLHGTIQPFLEISMKVQAEVLALWGHRARAWLDWPDQCISCKSLHDLTSAQGEYITRMHRDYARFLECLSRDALIEPEEYEEEAETGMNPAEADELHRKAA